MSTAQLDASAPGHLGDDVVAVLVQAALDLWTGAYGTPDAGTVLTLLWCRPDEYVVARSAPHRHLDLVAGPDALGADLDETATIPRPPVRDLRPVDVTVIVTDDEGARDHPRVWCEIEKT
ncbi:hypothetical protein RDV89_00020 [Nocardioides zeae]|uniref:Uncharacterized protein n=1 Tax=Nocardioides imazamoxiresistens TaxID=3231893 RepID=A0ABU3PQC6_9ACTN|nr:hypothetical protein [Nocardioides zeae]MDT9591429.1 hypothetical protein [Nocardioides zeae]